MYEAFDIWTFLAGLPLGLAIAAILMWVSRRKMRKERAFDERYTRIQQDAKSISWMVTTIAILVAWMIVIFIEGPKLAFFVLAAIWVIHMLSYAIGAVVANNRN